MQKLMTRARSTPAIARDTHIHRCAAASAIYSLTLTLRNNPCTDPNARPLDTLAPASSDRSESLSGGAVTGISVGAVFGLLVLLAVAVLVVRAIQQKRRKGEKFYCFQPELEEDKKQQADSKA